jgi:hypothetical protein
MFLAKRNRLVRAEGRRTSRSARRSVGSSRGGRAPRSRRRKRGRPPRGRLETKESDSAKQRRPAAGEDARSAGRPRARRAAALLSRTRKKSRSARISPTPSSTGLVRPHERAFFTGTAPPSSGEDARSRGRRAAPPAAALTSRTRKESRPAWFSSASPAARLRSSSRERIFHPNSAAHQRDGTFDVASSFVLGRLPLSISRTGKNLGTREDLVGSPHRQPSFAFTRENSCTRTASRIVLDRAQAAGGGASFCTACYRSQFTSWKKSWPARISPATPVGSLRFFLI